MTQHRPRLSPEQYARFLTSEKEQKEQVNLLVIPDLHEPFCLDGYREWVYEMYLKHNCNKVIFLGDILDNHASSYHESETEAEGADRELEHAKKKVALWYEMFPEADVCIGNHDGMAARKAKSGQISKQWLKSYAEVLETPSWNFEDSFVYNDILFRHGIGMQASSFLYNTHQSVVQGHFHGKTYITYTVSMKERLFAWQLGCGIDRKAYAMAYGKHFPKPQINCGIIKDLYGAILPITEYMSL